MGDSGRVVGRVRLSEEIPINLLPLFCLVDLHIVSDVSAVFERVAR